MKRNRMMVTEGDMDRAYAAAAADVFERSYQESIPPEVCEQIRERQQLQAEFDSILDRARHTMHKLRCWK